MSNLYLGTFRTEVTPPVGHPLCAGWIRPAVGITDPLFAGGVVLVGEDSPIVLCSVDWCEISNQDHALWRQALAAASGTTPERVAVQCVHQHDAPWPDLAAQALVSEAEGLPDLMDISWCQGALDRVADAVRESLGKLQPVTHLRLGQAAVEKVASNRRIYGPDGKVRAVRFSACRDEAVRAEPEGLIDPMLKTISFWNNDAKLAVLHYYAVHPMSYYGNGWVTADFVGHARDRRAAEDGGAAHIYFTGCAGNIAAGKYNDGSPENRPVLEERIYRALGASEQQTERVGADGLVWRVKEVAFPPDLRRSEEQWLRLLSDPAQAPGERYRAAFRIAYLHRHAAGATIPLTSLFLGDRVCLLHLPGEPFIEYQLFAQELRSDLFVAVAGYSDCATGYIPLARSYEEGGYEPKDAFVSPGSEAILRSAIRELLM